MNPENPEPNQEPETFQEILNKGREARRSILDRIDELKVNNKALEERNWILEKKLDQHRGSPEDIEKEQAENDKVLDENDKLIEQLRKEKEEIEERTKQELKEFKK